MNNPEKLAAYGTQSTIRRQTKQRDSPICVGHHYEEAKRNNINKTLTLLLIASIMWPNLPS
jgi:hypothetical protein